MLKRRQGFTLIELLIVIVIIGILAAIAIPKFGATREKAYFKAMMSDLRNLQAQQELFFSNPNNAYTYASGTTTGATPSATLPDFTASEGVTVTYVGEALGWSAQATHLALPGENCGVFVGDAGTFGAGGAPANASGVVACSDAPPAP